MALSAQHLTSTYSVEVSGWDSTQSFFVEKSELSWNEETGKLLSLVHQLCPGTMIFVRLLQPTASDRTFPVAYQAEPLGTTPEGQQLFRLTRVQPRSTPEERHHSSKLVCPSLK
ncbi:MAG TPA: hypothetical protein VMH48_04070 [Methylomirabilota bacterium]|nr:hypothetical protein [Methylomirabilota bacterium]